MDADALGWEICVGGMTISTSEWISSCCGRASARSHHHPCLVGHGDLRLTGRYPQRRRCIAPSWSWFGCRVVQYQVDTIPRTMNSIARPPGGVRCSLPETSLLNSGCRNKPSMTSPGRPPELASGCRPVVHHSSVRVMIVVFNKSILLDSPVTMYEIRSKKPPIQGGKERKQFWAC